MNTTKTNATTTKLQILPVNKVWLLGKALLALSLLLALAAAATAAPRETDPIWRIQLAVRTANVSDAGTDDNVRVQLNGVNSTWLDYGRNDFPRNNIFTYDLNLTGVTNYASLTQLRFSKEGSDGLCVKSLALIVNGREIYSEIFAGNGRWFDNDGIDTRVWFVNSTTLRNDDSWRAFTQPFPPFVIGRTELESRIEGMVGDFAKGNRLQWGHLYGARYVEVTKKAGTTNMLHADLDMEIDVPYYFNPEVDIDFDIRVNCVNNQIKLEILNFKAVVDSDWYAEVLSLNLIQFLDAYINDKMSAALNNIKLAQQFNVPFCPVITINSTGDVIFSLPSNNVAPLAIVRQLGVQTASRTTTTRTTARPANSAENTDDVAQEQVLVAAEGVMTVDTVEMLEPAASEASQHPLIVDIETPKTSTPGEDAAYTVKVQANGETATDVNVQIALPANVTVATGSVIEVVDANGARTLNAAITVNEQGATVLTFTDLVAAGAENSYTVRVRFNQATTDVQIVATVFSGLNALPIESNTFFHAEAGVLEAQGTLQKVPSAKPVQ